MWEEQVADGADLFPQGFAGSGCRFSDQGFQVGERHLDRVQVWRVGRQEDQVVALGAQEREGGAGCVGRQVVGRNDLTGPEGRGALVGDASLEAGAGHRAVTAPWRDQAVLGKACDEGLGVPVAEGA